MIFSTSIGASVLVPNYGWVIWGGYDGTTLSHTSQKLQTLSGKWTAGPNTYQNLTDFFNCAVQVNLNHIELCSFS